MSMFTTAIFLETMEQVQKKCHQNSADHGFWEGSQNIGEKLALIHSEISEALEAHRNPLPSADFGNETFDIREFGIHETQWWTEDGGVYDSPSKDLPIGKVKPEGFGIEMADAVIRIMDLCEHLKIDLGQAILDKMTYNATRPMKHSKAY